jgi:hypothetical protein
LLLAPQKISKTILPQYFIKLNKIFKSCFVKYLYFCNCSVVTWIHGLGLALPIENDAKIGEMVAGANNVLIF